LRATVGQSDKPISTDAALPRDSTRTADAVDTSARKIMSDAPVGGGALPAEIKSIKLKRETVAAATGDGENAKAERSAEISNLEEQMAEVTKSIDAPRPTETKPAEPNTSEIPPQVLKTEIVKASEAEDDGRTVNQTSPQAAPKDQTRSPEKPAAARPETPKR